MCVCGGKEEEVMGESAKESFGDAPKDLFLNLGGYKCSLCKNPCICTLTIHAVMICMPKLVWVIFQ